MGKNKQNPEMVETAESNALPSEIVENNIVEGVVSNCEKLYIRKVPKPGSFVVCIVDAGTILQVNKKESNKDFYKVTTEAGWGGFAMCQFVTIE